MKMKNALQQSGTALLVVACLLGCKLLPKSHRRSPPAAPEPLTQTHDSANGLVTLHYPASFAAEKVGTGSIVLSRNLPNGHSETVSFVTIEEPISHELAEFARVVQAAQVKKLDGYAPISERTTACNAVTCIESTGTWHSSLGSVTYRRLGLAFIKNGHGYAFSYSVPQTEAATDELLLAKIVESTDFNR
jgi:hypothetical protein